MGLFNNLFGCKKDSQVCFYCKKVFNDNGIWTCCCEECENISKEIRYLYADGNDALKSEYYVLVNALNDNLISRGEFFEIRYKILERIRYNERIFKRECKRKKELEVSELVERWRMIK